MSGAELRAHVRELADGMGVEVWVLEGSEAPEFGRAVKENGRRFIGLTAPPDTRAGYLVALHELGHHAWPHWGRGGQLDREAFAWRWALERCALFLGRSEWGLISGWLKGYAQSRSYARSDAFRELYAEAVARS